jgi:hypothetical protein
MEKYSLYAAWIGILFGLLSGLGMGLLFHKETWLGGYGSWPRRLLRLGHVSFFGIAFLNFAFVGTIAYLHVNQDAIAIPSILFIVAQITMPTVCILAAFKKQCRHLFAVPVVSVIAASAAFLFAMHGVLR